MNDIVVKDVDLLYEYSQHLHWAANDLAECYQKMKAHTNEVATQWNDSVSARFMQKLENEEHIILEIKDEFDNFGEFVKKRADIVQEYVDCGKNFNL
jgi:putative sterol carrier protein